MSDDPRAGAYAVHNFINELRAAFERAGPPTYARLEELSNRLHNPDPAAGQRVLVLPHSTTHDILTRNRERLPSWQWVASFVHVLRAAAVENGLDPEVVGATAEWHIKYRQARAAIQQASPPSSPLAAPTPPTAVHAQVPHITRDDLGTDGPPPEPDDPVTRSESGSAVPFADAADRWRYDDPLSVSDATSYSGSLPAIDWRGTGKSSSGQLFHTRLSGSSGVSDLNRYSGGFNGSLGTAEQGPAGAYGYRPDSSDPLSDHGPSADPLNASTEGGEGSGFGDAGDPNNAGDQIEDTSSTVPPPERTIMWRRYVEAYGRTGMRLLRHAEADEGKARGVPAYRLATLLACEHRPLEALYWMQRAAQAGNDEARKLVADWIPAADGRPPVYWRPTDAAYEIGLHYEGARQPFSAAVFFDRAAGNGHDEAAYRAGLHRMQIGHYWDAMLLFSRAARHGHMPAQRELNGLLPHFNHIPPFEMLAYGPTVGSNMGLPYRHLAL